MMPGDDVLSEPSARRVEVFTGGRRRRRWSDEAKILIVAESYATSVGETADRHGLSKTQVFTWRREARKPGERVQPEPVFAPVVIEAPSAPSARIGPKPKKNRRARGGIELEIDGVVMRVERGAEARTVAAVIQALKASR